MEKKKFNRGTISGGIIRIVIALVAIIIAITILSTKINSWDADDAVGGVFLCVIASIIIIASVADYQRLLIIIYTVNIDFL